ncbi:membrane protein [Clostridia bacterium]|nr:membrane protein [Clostridia bacterium]
MLYFKYVRINVYSLVQHQSTFWLSLVGQALVSLFSFIAMLLYFDRFGSIGGWTFGEAALCFAVVTMAFSIAECFARGFDTFRWQIISGDFDRLLVRPRGLLLQVFGSSFELGRLGRVVEGAAILMYAIPLLDIVWIPSKAITLCLMIVSGAVIFIGVFILGAAMCFRTVQGLEIVNILTDGGREIAQYPMTIYTRWAVMFFTYIVPFGCFNYLPLMYLTGRVQGNPALYILSPIIGMLFIIPCALVWRAGVRRYLSTGS